MGACCGNDEEYQTATKFYCHACCVKHNTPCIVCGETLFNEEMWNDILGRKEMCNTSCQYTILISNWVKKGTFIEATWRRAWMAITKIEGALPEEIRTIKNNPPEFIKLDWDAEPVINFLEPEEFHEHYQNLASTREEQEQWLA
ncbi:hypothetical protein G9A89_013488 [Geosiphon pyriformis]|nr:hypothetical protein G9A89_013488 [Geosiphon pyriformis]